MFDGKFWFVVRNYSIYSEFVVIKKVGRQNSSGAVVLCSRKFIVKCSQTFHQQIPIKLRVVATKLKANMHFTEWLVGGFQLIFQRKSHGNFTHIVIIKLTSEISN